MASLDSDELGARCRETHQVTAAVLSILREHHGEAAVLVRRRAMLVPLPFEVDGRVGVAVALAVAVPQRTISRAGAKVQLDRYVLVFELDMKTAIFDLDSAVWCCNAPSARASASAHKALE
eukprot:CAMPEP_0119489422 /NCGR_PEP_ID=MMETSP1344-20130328/14870_1 /TAXON_ID=236787 /ORGANISM="Florenciella parvula, Strain CCMP2471" /LENGTH=120 /DNA_ID=CAMNT_0007524463 /DNA_START=266 /DNA_END=629 /DNA_ORIENTATION=-